jgi:flagellar motor protein MotB
LKEEGGKVLENLGKIIHNHASLIEEIQIQGNADTTRPDDFDFYKSNIELASARATTVFNFLRINSGVDPSDILMSIVSYGEFNPVQRRKNQQTWSRKTLNEANDTEDERSKNRRIEIVLIYK